MTTIGVVTIDVPAEFTRDGYSVNLKGSSGPLVDCTDTTPQVRFNQLRELFAKARVGAAIHDIPGARPVGEDLTDDLHNTYYIDWTHGMTGKVQDGYYLLMPDFSFIDGGGVDGYWYVWSINLFFLGTRSIYCEGFRCKRIDEMVTEWDI